MDFLKPASIIITLLVVAYFGYQEIDSLRGKNAELTMKLETAIQTLEKVAEYNKKIDEVTSRLEKADEARQKQLRGFERNLGRLAKQSEEARALLSIIIPDNMLTGLRSFEATLRSDTSAQGAGKSSDAP